MFWNPWTIAAHVLKITAPGGFESFYEEMAEAQSPAEALSIQTKYGITFHQDRIADLVARHGLVP